MRFSKARAFARIARLVRIRDERTSEALEPARLGEQALQAQLGGRRRHDGEEKLGAR